MRSGLGRKPLLILGLIAPHLLAGELERPGYGLLRDALRAGVKDGAAKLAAALRYQLARCYVGISGRDNIAHRVRHLPIMTSATWLWPLPMMPHKQMQRN